MAAHTYRPREIRLQFGPRKLVGRKACGDGSRDGDKTALERLRNTLPVWHVHHVASGSPVANALYRLSRKPQNLLLLSVALAA